MTDPLETVVCDAARTTERVSVPEIVRDDLPQLHADEFLDDEWAEEFDRRLAAWESEAPVATLTQ